MSKDTLPTNMKQFIKQIDLPPEMKAVATEEFMTEILRNIQFDRATGQRGLNHEKMHRYIASQVGSPWYKKLVASGFVEEERPKPDMSSADLSSLPSVPETWTLELYENMEWPLEIRGKAFITKQWVMVMSCGDAQKPRQTDFSTDKPTEAEVLTFVQEGFAAPKRPFEPGLPTLLLLSPDYAPYHRALQAFFDSLPHPLTWEFNSVASRQDADKVQLTVDSLLGASRRWKRVGNEAYAEKDAAQALTAYTSGIDHLDLAVKGFGSKMSPDALDAVRELLGTCHANRAAVYLWHGKEFSPKKAEADGRLAEKADPGYAKAYYRQARAHECLGDMGKACEVLRRALRQEELMDDADIQAELDRYLAMAAAY
ncbi:hypothetical protein OF83DRAFT_1155473 [Amylostereum chailletii]|nr:hypothetical protein OF83DRAFT_1155473 [Amylostereum chailletii]